MDCIVHGILQARILEWVAVPFSRGSSQPRDWTQVSHIAGGLFTIWATSKALKSRHFSYISHPCVSVCVVAPQPGMEPTPPAVGEWGLNHRITREVPISSFVFLLCLVLCVWVCFSQDVCTLLYVSLLPEASEKRIYPFQESQDPPVPEERLIFNTHPSESCGY